MTGQNTSSSKSTTKASHLSAADIVSIIKAGDDANVSEITVGGLHVKYNGAKCPEDLTNVANSPNNGLRSVPFEPVTSDEDQLDQLILSNPSEYEAMVEVTE